MPLSQYRNQARATSRPIRAVRHLLLAVLLCTCPHAGASPHGDPLAPDSAMIFGYVDTRELASPVDTVLINQVGSEAPMIEAEVRDGLFFVLGLPKGEYRLAYFKGQRRIGGKVSMSIDLGRHLGFRLDGRPVVFLGAYRYTATTAARPAAPLPELKSPIFMAGGPVVARTFLPQPSESELLDRIANLIASKSELAPFRHHLDRIAARKAEVASTGEPMALLRLIQQARENGQWGTVFDYVNRRAESHDPVFLTALAQLHANGLGTPISQVLAFHKSALAATQDYAPALQQMGDFIGSAPPQAKDMALMVRLLERSAAQGYSEAQFALGRLHHSGALGSIDEAKALAWYEQSAEQGFARAWTNLGVLHANAKTIRLDPARTRSYFEKAANAGESMAHFNLALDYLRDGTSDSLERAYFHALLADNNDARNPCIPPALWVAARVEAAGRDALPRLTREEAARQSCMRAMPQARGTIARIENVTGPNALSDVRRQSIRQEASRFLEKRALIDASPGT